MNDERLAEIEARHTAATPGPWCVWDGPAYSGGGRDLCIGTADELMVGAGDDWIANMDHRYGPDFRAREMHDEVDGHDWSRALRAGEAPGSTACQICSFSAEVDREQSANAAFIAQSWKDVKDLLAEVRRLRRYVPEIARFADPPPPRSKKLCVDCDEPATRWVNSSWEQERTGVPMQFRGWCEEHWPGPKE